MVDREPPLDDSADDVPHHEDCDGGDDCRCEADDDEWLADRLAAYAT